MSGQDQSLGRPAAPAHLSESHEFRLRHVGVVLATNEGSKSERLNGFPMLVVTVDLKSHRFPTTLILNCSKGEAPEIPLS